MTTSSAPLTRLSSVPVSRRFDVRVVWREGFKPLAFPHVAGRVFLSKGARTYVIWDGTSHPSMVATAALAVQS